MNRNEAIRFDGDLLRQCWFLTGPTACGKSDVGLALADALGAEIISMDSMCLYRGMDIGTAKPIAEARTTTPHHLIDVLEPHEEYSVAEYVDAAERACRSILAHKRVPLFVGGTALYLRSVLRGVFDGPAADWGYRRQMTALARAREPGYLHCLLADVDPVLARRLHPRDERRVLRALEVQHLTGQPLSEQQRQPPLPIEERPQAVFWLSPPRRWLYERIDARVEQMFASGLVAEVRHLLASEKPLSRTARQALGYKEVIDCLESGREGPEVVELIQTRTRQFAKRQHTWFRHLAECTPVPIEGHESATVLAQRIHQLAREAKSSRA